MIAEAQVLTKIKTDLLSGKPMDRLEYLVNEHERAESLLILMAGAGDNHHAFAEHGVIALARQATLAADILTVDAGVDYFTSETLREHLHDDVVATAKSQGYKRIWMGGISLGGFASLIYARRYAHELAGLVLIAPYIGNRGTLVEIESAGGLDAWQPGALEDNDERTLWQFIKTYRADCAPALPIHLLYARNDRFARFHALLASRLAPQCVTTIEGGHDWMAWRALWQQFLNSKAQQFFDAARANR
jgi:pimeloyl-ACP methyl ester carboxylesterase